MATYIAFLRAVNVGGRKVPMAELRSCVEEAGFTEVATHIQSGNLRVATNLRSAAKVEKQLEQVMPKAFGFDIPAIVRTPAQLRQLVADAPANPLGEAARHYVAFLRSKPPASRSAELDGWDVDGERLLVLGRDAHLWLDKPAHEAKLTNTRLEKLAGTESTMRNWNVVSTLAEKWA